MKSPHPSNALALFALLALAGCTVEPGDDEQVSDLRAATTTLPVIGSFQLAEDIDDQSREFFGKLPAGGAWYAASFEGRAGQAVILEALILNSGDLTAELYEPSGDLLALNDDYDDIAELPWADKNPRFELTLPADGVYLLAFREKGGLGGPLLARGEGAGGGAEPSVFDDDWCAGAPLTSASAAAGMPAGSTTLALGSATLAQRSRSCTGATGCGPWGDVEQHSKLSISTQAGRFPVEVSSAASFDVRTNAQSGQAEVRFELDTHAATPNVASSRVSCRFSTSACLPSKGLYLGDTFFSKGPGNDGSWSIGAPRARSTFTSTCSRIAMSGRRDIDSSKYVETEAVWAVRY
jgi:hypothetical protein